MSWICEEVELLTTRGDCPVCKELVALRSNEEGCLKGCCEECGTELQVFSPAVVTICYQ